MRLHRETEATAQDKCSRRTCDSRVRSQLRCSPRSGSSPNLQGSALPAKEPGFCFACKQSSPMKHRRDSLAFSANASSFVKDIIRCCHTRGIKYPWLCKQDQTLLWAPVGRTPPARQMQASPGFRLPGWIYVNHIWIM